MILIIQAFKCIIRISFGQAENIFVRDEKKSTVKRVFLSNIVNIENHHIAQKILKILQKYSMGLMDVVKAILTRYTQNKMTF